MATKPTSRQRAQGLVEYILGLALVAIVCVVVLLTLGHSISNTFSNLTTTFGVAQSSPAATPSSSCLQHSQQPQNCNSH